MKNRKLLYFYIGTFMLMCLTQLWDSNGYPGIFKENFNGGFQRFSLFKCQSDYISNCSSINFSKRGRKILLGDSEAMSLSDEFKKRFGSDALVFADYGCSFLPEAISIKGRDKKCRKMNSVLFNKLTTNCLSDVYVFNRFIPTNSKEGSDYVEFLKLVNSTCNHLVVIGTPPQIIKEYSAYATLFFATSFDSPRSFAKNDFFSNYANWNLKLKKKLEGIPTLTYLDTEKLLITKFPTTLRNVSGDYLFTDMSHVSKYGAEIIANHLS